MSYYTGTATSVYDFLDKLKTHAALNDWSSVYDTVNAGSREIYLRNGTTNTVVGFKEFTGTGYSNLRINVPTSYDNTLSWYLQEGSVPQTGGNTSNTGYAMPVLLLQNNPITYFLTISVNCIVIVCRISGVTSSGYLGRIDQAGSPEQYKYPHFCGGMSGTTTTLLSETGYNNNSFLFDSSRTRDGGSYVKLPNGDWSQVIRTQSSADDFMMPAPRSNEVPSKSGKYKIYNFELFTSQGYLGSLFNVAWCTGFNLSVESDMAQDSTYKIFNNAYRLTNDNFFLLKKD